MYQVKSFFTYCFIIIFLIEFTFPSVSESRRRHKPRAKKMRSTSYNLPDKFDFPKDHFEELKSVESDTFDFDNQFTSNWALGPKGRKELRRTLYLEAKKTCRDQYPPKKTNGRYSKFVANEKSKTQSERGCDYTQEDCVARACVIAADEFEIDPHLLYCVLRRETHDGKRFNPMASLGGGNGLAQFTPPAFNEVMDDLFTKAGGIQENSDNYKSFTNYFRSINETRLNLTTGHANFSFHQNKNNSTQKYPYINFCDPVQSIGAAAAYLSLLGAGPNLSAGKAAKFAKRYNGNPNGGIMWAYGEYANKCTNASKKIAVFASLIKQGKQLSQDRNSGDISAKSPGSVGDLRLAEVGGTADAGGDDSTR
jgi:hypothetical protein